MSENYYIYLITNLVNGKFYVGKSNRPSIRWGDHRKVALGGREKYPAEFFAIHAALSKYGIDNFRFEIIDELDDEQGAYRTETRWILLLCSNLKKFGYNCNLGGEGGVKPNEETRQKLIIAQNKPEKIKISSDMMKKRHHDNPGFLSALHKGNQYTKGKKLSDVHKKKLSEHFSGRLVSKETKLKISGENNKCSKLTETQVLDIRSKHIPGQHCCNKNLAKEYHVSIGTIERIISRKSWKHI